MFNIGTQELLVILVLALVVVGPQKLPELARSIGRGMREFRKMQDEVKDMVKVDLNPEPPSVHTPGVSGPKSPRTPHRTPRSAPSAPDASAAVTDGNGTADDPAATPASPEAGSGDVPPVERGGSDGPPAAAGAG